MKSKPRNLKYTDMCIYIDSHIYEPNPDIEIIFNYLQYLFYGLAYKKKFFRNKDDYEKYSIFAATQVYLRLTNSRQFLPEDDPKKLTKVKSVLNYIKTILYPMKVDYQKQFFNKVFDDKYNGEGVVENIQSYLVNNIKDNNRLFLVHEVEDYFSYIPNLIWNVLKQTPYCKDKVTLSNLYISCLLTLLNKIILNNEDKDKYRHNPKFKLNSEELISSLLRKEDKLEPIIFHLDESMKNYISVLVVKIKKLIVQDIQMITNCYEPQEQIMETILIQPLLHTIEGEE